jgi:spore maturation protein CgeB
MDGRPSYSAAPPRAAAPRRFLMRILIVDTCYPAFLDAHYGAESGLADASYAEQWRRLMDTFFGTADSYSYHLGLLGHDAHEVVANCEPLQLAWAREHGVAAAGGREAADAIVLAQAADFEPDVVYVQDLHYLRRSTLRELGRRRVLAGQIASAAPSAWRLRLFDLVLTSFPHYVGRFRRLGVRSELFRIGFDERVLGHLGEPARDGGAVFVGALNRRRHRRGNTVLEQAARRSPIDFWGYGARGWPRDSPVVTRYRGAAWGLDMYRVLRRARIAVNRHIREAGDYANNMRLYEATGVGTMLVTDEKANISELFEPGREVVTYRDARSLADAVNHYLAHEHERQAIAAAGQARTLSDHTYAARMRELVEILGRAG